MSHHLDAMRRAAIDTGSPIPPRNAAELARIERTSVEHHARLALMLWQGADAFGRVVATVEHMGNEGYQAIVDEADAADKIVIDGPEIIRALRSLAMRLDRAVMVKATEGD
jgi:hypothetical protein